MILCITQRSVFNFMAYFWLFSAFRSYSCCIYKNYFGFMCSKKKSFGITFCRRVWTVYKAEMCCYIFYSHMQYNKTIIVRFTIYIKASLSPADAFTARRAIIKRQNALLKISLIFSGIRPQILAASTTSCGATIFFIRIVAAHFKPKMFSTS